MCFKNNVIKKHFGQTGDKVTRGDNITNSGKISTLPRQLGKGHTGPVGLRRGDGVQDRIPEPTHSNEQPQGGRMLLGRAASHKRGDQQNALQRGDNRVTPGGSTLRVLLEPVPSPKEGWGCEASDKPEEPQRVCGPTTFQDGRDSHSKGFTTKRRLDDEDRSEGRLLHDSNPHDEQVGASFLDRAKPIRVLLPAIRPVMRSLGLYQDPEAGTNPTQRVGCKASGIHRRHTRPGGDRGDREESYLSVNIPVRKPGLYSTPRENGDRSIPGDRIPWNDGRLQNNGTTVTGSEAEKASFGGCKDQRSISHTLSPRGVTPTGQIQLGDASSPTEPPVLQSNTERSGNSSREEQSELQCAMSTIPSIQGGIGLVDTPASTLEREESGNDTTRPSYRIRCLPHRMGSVLRGDTHGRPVVLKGKMLPHKLPRATSGDAGSQNIPEGPGKQTRPAIIGQYNSSGVCKQSGRDSLRPGNETSQRAMDVVSRTSDSPDSTAFARERQRQGRHGVETDEGSLRLDVEPIDISIDCGNIPVPGGRSVCNTPDLTPPSFLQLETRPTGRSDGRLPPRLESNTGLCQPPMELGGKGSGEGAKSGSRPDSGGANMAVTTLVSQSTGTSERNSSENRSSGGGNSANGGSKSRGNSASSRVAYLRQHYTSQRLSGEATTLLLSSWRKKSSQSYDSLCKKWISWCSERQADPVSGPIEDVVNFLAFLHSENYQYRSLNSYRSAIASMHAPVDGVSIGQHPLVTRLLKGAFQTRPPLPRYTGTWDVNQVLNLLQNDPLDKGTSLKRLSQRTVMLLALTRPSRSVDLAKLDLRGYRNTPEGAVFTPFALAKQSRPGKEIREFFFPSFPENIKLCPVHSLTMYIEKTRALRSDNNQLFVSTIKPHGSVTSSTIARWLKEVMAAAGIDTSTFKAHSVRSASTSAASMQGVTTQDILSAADWSTESTFQKFYYKPVRNTVFAKSVLAATNNTIDMETEPSEI